MNLQQLRYVREVARQALNISDAAAALFTSQPGVSRQIRQLEEELGTEIFLRRGKKLIGITEAGQRLLEVIGRILTELQNLRQIGAEFAHKDSGSLSIATTHTQARYVLPKAVQEFRLRYPDVRLVLRQGNPEQLCQWVINGEADLAIASEALDAHADQLALLPGYRWHHLVIAPEQHPIHAHKRLTLPILAQYPLITYDPAFSGRNRINQAFAQAGITPQITLSAIDADIIKVYVKLGLGVGVVAAMAFEPNIDHGLLAIDVGHLFEASTTRIGLRKDAWLRGFTFDFIGFFAPHLTRRVIEATLTGGGEDSGL